MNRAVTFLLTGWAFAGALLTWVLMCFAGASFLTPAFPWNFPGDPPAFELMILTAVLRPASLCRCCSSHACPAAAAGDKERVLTQEEFQRFREKFVPRPLPVALPGYGTVHLRMAHGIYPYVGVDFGDGANALLDPKTMLCMYAD